MARLAKKMAGCLQPGQKAYKDGGAVHDDEAMDRALIKKTVKKSSLTGKKAGGKACCK
jgi:hypothetical protein